MVSSKTVNDHLLSSYHSLSRLSRCLYLDTTCQQVTPRSAPNINIILPLSPVRPSHACRPPPGVQSPAIVVVPGITIRQSPVVLISSILYNSIMVTGLYIGENVHFKTNRLWINNDKNTSDFLCDPSFFCSLSEYIDGGYKIWRQKPAGPGGEGGEHHLEMCQSSPLVLLCVGGSPGGQSLWPQGQTGLWWSPGSLWGRRQAQYYR